MHRANGGKEHYEMKHYQCLSVSEKYKRELNATKAFISAKLVKVPSLEMRRFPAFLLLSLLPEIGQRARIFMSEIQ